MLLFVGLGNPNPNNSNNRHNVGFFVIDEINKKFKLSKQKPKFKGLLTTGKINEQKVYAIKPLTFMNSSGVCVKELIEYFKIDNPEYSQPRLLLPLILSLSYLMVSRVHYAKFPIINFNSGKQNSLRLLGVALFIVTFIGAIFIGFPYRVLAGFVSFYLLTGIWNHLKNLGNV